MPEGESLAHMEQPLNLTDRLWDSVQARAGGSFVRQILDEQPDALVVSSDNGSLAEVHITAWTAARGGLKVSDGGSEFYLPSRAFPEYCVLRLCSLSVEMADSRARSRLMGARIKQFGAGLWLLAVAFCATRLALDWKSAAVTGGSGSLLVVCAIAFVIHMRILSEELTNGKRIIDPTILPLVSCWISPLMALALIVLSQQ